jgi:glycolate oxidase FAD binding subunit
MSHAPATVLTRLASIVGEGNCASDAGELARYAVDGVTPAVAVRPGSAEEVAEVVRFAAAEKLALIASGSGSKLGIGMPPARYDVALELTRLNRIVSYDPGDLTLSVEAGMGISVLFDALGEKSQWLPLYVPWFERATLGGILASNSISPLRYMFGGPRDFLLGMEFVTGDGALCKSGARVVKSVAGYDLHKVLLGSLGSLGVITKVNFRTFPLPRAQRCFVAAYSDLHSAWDFCRRIAQSPLKPSLVEVLDPGAARILADAKLPADQWCVVGAAIGHEPVVERHARDLAQLARDTRAVSFEALEDADKQRLLGRVREFPRIVSEQHPETAVLRASVLPSTVVGACERLSAIAAQHGLKCATLVRAGNTAYCVLHASGAEAVARLAVALRALMDPAAGISRFTIEQCPATWKHAVNVWGPVREDFALMQRLKQVFDPHGILSPGRFVGGL